MSIRKAKYQDKKKSKLRRKRQDQLKLRARIERVIRVMGIEMIKLTRISDEYLYRLTDRRPRVIPDPGQIHDAQINRMAFQLETKLDGVGLEIRGELLTFDDLIQIAIPLSRLLSDEDAVRIKSPNSDFSSKLRTKLSEFRSGYWDQVEQIHFNAVMGFLARKSRFDSAIYTAKQGFIRDGEGSTFTTVLRKYSPQMVIVDEDGFKRKAYRCGASEDLDTGDVYWTTWDAHILGRQGRNSLPVFVQSHAIDQAKKRLCIVPEDHMLHHCIWQSLQEPRLLFLKNDRFLVDLLVNDGKKVGYLVGSLRPDCVLIRTFLLPTMQGTPEAYNLLRILRLRRPDIEYLGLDDMRTLAATDLLRDPEVARIFEECGCRDLVRLAKEDFDGDIRSGHAERFKTFLGPSSFSRFSSLHCAVTHVPIL